MWLGVILGASEYFVNTTKIKVETAESPSDGEAEYKQGIACLVVREQDAKCWSQPYQ